MGKVNKMNLKKCISISIVLLFAAVFLAHSEEETSRIDPSAFHSPQRPGTVFDHDGHNSVAELDYDCSICHHVYENGTKVEGESSEDRMCSECHSLEPTAENPMPLRTAFHRQCRSCHFDREKGPVLCGECHKKQ